MFQTKNKFMMRLGSSQYTPLSSYSYKDEPDSPNFDALQEARSPRELFIQVLDCDALIQ